MGSNAFIFDFLFGRAIGGRGGVALFRFASSLLRTRPIFADLLHTSRCCFAPVLVLHPPVSSPLHLHHGGHIDADVFRHHRPRLPLVHHLPAVMLQLRATQPHAASDEGFPCPASLVSSMSNGTETMPLLGSSSLV